MMVILIFYEVLMNTAMAIKSDLATKIINSGLTQLAHIFLAMAVKSQWSLIKLFWTIDF